MVRLHVERVPIPRRLIWVAASLLFAAQATGELHLHDGVPDEVCTVCSFADPGVATGRADVRVNAPAGAAATTLPCTPDHLAPQPLGPERARAPPLS